MIDSNSRNKSEHELQNTSRLFDAEEYKARIDLVREDIRNAVGKEGIYYSNLFRKFYDSIFPLLIRCLQNSEDYKKALEGLRGEPYASVAADLGDVFAFSKSSNIIWWFMHGSKVFGEFEEFKDVGASAANADDVEHRGRSGEYEGISRM